MRRPRIIVVLLALTAVVVAVSNLPAVAAPAEEDFRYREGRAEGAELRFINGLPVLLLQGTPETMGRQQGALNADVAGQLSSFPAALLRAIHRDDRWAAHVKLSRAMAKRFPADHLAELEALARSARVDRDLLIGVNTLPDAYRGGLGCSSLMVEARRSKTGGPLFGRNLDFFTLGQLQKFSLVTVYRPKGKHAFASIGFPGLIGCLSGMNDAGLALAVHEVQASRDGSPLFDPEGVAYGLCFRRVLEECATVAEAEKLLRSVKRTTLLNLAVCDRATHAVLELTPRSVAVRRGTDGICACTNHFRTEELKFVPDCPRYDRLVKAQSLKLLGVDDVAAKLHNVNQGRMTLQTMVFEPAALRLHLAIGSCPSSAMPLKKIELGPLLGKAAAKESGEGG